MKADVDMRESEARGILSSLHHVPGALIHLGDCKCKAVRCRNCRTLAFWPDETAGAPKVIDSKGHDVRGYVCPNRKGP